MSKSVYSIVLSDDVVAAVDMLAIKLGTNRSNLINQILAERVSVITPERRMKDIFDSIFSLMDERFIRDVSAAGSALAVRSSIAYKYKPTVRYSLEILRAPEGEMIGNLRISFRTRSQAFMDMLAQFYRIWIDIESAYTGRSIQYRAESDKLIRGIYFPKGRTSAGAQELGALIGEYIKTFDSAIKIFFSFADQPELAAVKVGACYKSSLKNGIADI